MPEPTTDLPSQEFIELVQRVLDKESSLDDLAELNRILAQDPQSLSYFVKMRMLHSHLVDKLGTSSSGLTGIHQATKKAKSSPITEQLTLTQPSKLTRPVIIKMALATAALILLSFLIPVGYRSAVAEGAYQVVATHNTQEFQRGTWMTTHKTYSLKEGSIQINSSDHNRLTIQAPAKFTINSHREITLKKGKIWAELDGKPLDIHTPQGLVKDLGTTFGIDQSSAKSTRIDVLDGAIQLSRSATRQNKAEKGQALITDANQWPPKKVDADASLYTTKLRQSIGIVFSEYYFDNQRILAEQPLSTRWTVANTIDGSKTLDQSPVTVKWLCGYKLFPEGSANSAEAALFRTHLLSGHNDSRDLSAAKELGFTGDPEIGIIIRIENLQPWLEQIGASSYRIQVLRNSGQPNVHFLPLSIHLSESSPAIETQKTDSSELLSPQYPEPSDTEEGARSFTNFQTIFTADSLTLTTPIQQKGNDRGNISAVRIIPIFN
ncbi:FecR family protein [Rubritalea spongiae]|uniref:FecR family protein n=1 Tax=Rubritalea spongiae TaxID=430797 RepID=A0ABW5E2D8_9BACT